jgi:hypothetical protein
VREILSFDLSLDADNSEDIHGIRQSLQGNAGTVSLLRNDCFCPNPIQFIIRLAAESQSLTHGAEPFLRSC